VVPGDGECELHSVHNSSSPPFLPSHTFSLLQHGAFPQVAVLQDKSAPVCALQRPQLPSGQVHLLWHGVVYRLQYVYLLHCALSPGAAGNSFWGTWSTSSPSSVHLGARCVFFSLTSHCQAESYPCLHTLSIIAAGWAVPCSGAIGAS